MGTSMLTNMFSTMPNFCLQSLGCTLFALAYSHSPFENTQTTEQGGSIAMAVLNAQYKQPSSAYSQGLKDLIDAMLKVNPKDRPDIHKVCGLTGAAMHY
jgi:serine/threonine kinase 16